MNSSLAHKSVGSSAHALAARGVLGVPACSHYGSVVLLGVAEMLAKHTDTHTTHTRHTTHTHTHTHDTPCPCPPPPSKWTGSGEGKLPRGTVAEMSPRKCFIRGMYSLMNPFIGIMYASLSPNSTSLATFWTTLLIRMRARRMPCEGGPGTGWWGLVRQMGNSIRGGV
jgi:hypothetical protein